MNDIYDPQNVFARIIRGEIPCKKVYEDDYALAIHDINPAAAVHVLVLVKGPYMTLVDFVSKADVAFVAGYFKAVGKAAQAAGVVDSGCRFIANNGAHAHQEVAHLHTHILGGKPLGPLLSIR